MTRAPIDSSRRLAPMIGDALGEEDRAHAARLGAVLARELDRLALLGRRDVEGHLDDAVLDVVRDLVARLLEDGEHLAVLRQHLGDEPVDAHLLRDGGQVLEHDRADALALVVVRDVEGDLGRASGRCGRSGRCR